MALRPPVLVVTCHPVTAVTAAIAAIDPHQAQFTVGIVDPNGVELAHDSFRNTAGGWTSPLSRTPLMRGWPCAAPTPPGAGTSPR